MSTPEDARWGIVVPVKGGPDAKTRLHSPARAAIARAVARDTVAVAVDVAGADAVLVVTSDTAVADALGELGVAVTPDPGLGLDGAVSVGVRDLATRGLDRVAVLLGDHPCLTTAQLRAALEVSGRHTRAFVPDADGTGTAMVTTTRTATFSSAFGAGSAARHEALGMARLDLDLPGLRLDVDDLDDLDAAGALGLGPHTRAALLDYAAGRAGEHPHGR